jgi:hypothetical protein
MKIRQRLISIWSLGRRGEVTVRIYYRVRRAKGCRVFELIRVEEMEP